MSLGENLDEDLFDPDFQEDDDPEAPAKRFKTEKSQVKKIRPSKQKETSEENEPVRPKWTVFDSMYAQQKASPAKPTQMEPTIRPLAPPLPIKPAPAPVVNTSTPSFASPFKNQSPLRPITSTNIPASSTSSPFKVPEVMSTPPRTVRLEPQKPLATTTLVTSSPRTSTSYTGPASTAERTAMYWIDAREDTYSSPGTVYVFGKIWNSNLKQWSSCCLRVGGLNRCLFVLPRKEPLDERGNPIPGGQVEMVDLAKELGDLMASKNIPQRKMKGVDRFYAFEEEGVPREKTKWIKVRYPATSPPLGATDCSKYRTFSHIFGDRRSFLEMFLLKRKLKGPSWIIIQSPKVVEERDKLTWCTFEFSVDSPKTVSVMDDQPPPPPLTVMSLSLITHLNEKAKCNEIVGVTCLVQDRVNIDGKTEDRQTSKWTAIRRLGDNSNQGFPADLDMYFCTRHSAVPIKHTSERALLMDLISEIERRDPDMYIGHNFIGYDLDVILHRLDYHKIGNWSRIGRMHLRQMPKLQSGAGGTSESTWEEKAVLNGRLVADTYLLSKEYLKETSYKLLSLAITQDLKGINGKVTTEMADKETMVDVARELASTEGIYNLIQTLDNKAILSMQLVYKLSAIPLTKRLTSIAGNLWSKTLTGSRAERIEYLLLHKFHVQKFIVPDKRRKVDIEEGEATAGKGKPKYAGGKVLEPKKGLYTDYVLLLDFNSLYPSLIQEYNLCFTTVERQPKLADGTYPDAPVPSEDALICDHCQFEISKQKELEEKPTIIIRKGESCRHRCILPKAIRELVDSRRQVKKLLKEEKDPSQREQLDIRQKALKLTANSIYGCLGFNSSRFYAQPIAQLITSKGREALSQTAESVPKIEPTLDVIYGDTDSVMISTGINGELQTALQYANRIKQHVNKMYKHLEIDLDGVFKSILLVRKKKYAALTLVDVSKGDIPSNIKREVKGLDLVRRDWCPLSQRISTDILDLLLSGKTSDEILDAIHQYLLKVAQDIRNGNIEIKEFIITKSLTKSPEQYADIQNQPHVMVALRMKQKQLAQVQTGDFIPYIICDSETVPGEVDKGKLSNRAFHIDEIRHSTTLKPDLEWYLGTQIHPPVARLCEHIHGMDSRYIAHTLGLDGNKYVTHHVERTSEAPQPYHYTTHSYDLESEERFRDVIPLDFTCAKCKNVIQVSLRSRIQRAVERLFSEAPLDEKHARPVKLFCCESCNQDLPFPLVYNTVILLIRQQQRKYYSQWERISTHPPPQELAEIYPEQELRHQLVYLMDLFDQEKIRDRVYHGLERKLLQQYKKDSAIYQQQQRRLAAIVKAICHCTLPEELTKTKGRFNNQLQDRLQQLHRLVNIHITRCKRHYIDLNSIFVGMGEECPPENN